MMIKYINAIALEYAGIIYIWRKQPILIPFGVLTVCFMATIFWLAVNFIPGGLTSPSENRISAFINNNPFISLCVLVVVTHGWPFICLLWCKYKGLDWVSTGKKLGHLR